MAVPYRMIDIKTSDEAFKSIIIKYFDDFKKFMKSPDLQCSPINLVDKFDDLTCAHVKNGVLEVSKLSSYYKDKKTASNGKFVDMFDNCTIVEYFEKLNCKCQAKMYKKKT